jgi:hypothetical protein
LSTTSIVRILTKHKLNTEDRSTILTQTQHVFTPNENTLRHNRAKLLHELMPLQLCFSFNLTNELYTRLGLEGTAKRCTAKLQWPNAIKAAQLRHRQQKLFDLMELVSRVTMEHRNHFKFF